MKILIIGTWNKDKALTCKEEAHEIGKVLAERNLTLMSGAGTGTSGLVVESYKKHKGKRYVAFIPSVEKMELVGEEIGAEPDEIIHLDSNYPIRNATMVLNCDGVIALNGGLGTLSEIIHAVKDFKKKVVVIDKELISDYVKAIPELKKEVLLTKDINKAVDYLTESEQKQ